MQQIFVTNPKGGSGKTTISTHLAGYFSNTGAQVLLVDHDSQRSSSDWYAVRPNKSANLTIKAASLEESIDTRNFDYVVHDMPAAWSLDHVTEILHADDQVIIPILASPNDIKAALRFIIGLNRSGILEQGLKVGMLANRVRSNTNYAKIQRAFLDRMELPVIGHLRDTQNYINAMAKGITIFDLPPSRVKQDVEQWGEVLKWLGS